MSGPGKSLEQLQRRMQGDHPVSQQQSQSSDTNGNNQQGLNPQNPQQKHQQPAQQINPSPRPGKTSAALMASHHHHEQEVTVQPPQQSQQQPQDQGPPTQPPPARHKGKDFSAMANRMPPQAVVASAAPIVPAPSSGHPSVPATTKPKKGKDFSAMANRMGASGGPPQQGLPQQDPPNDPESEEAARKRKQQMQNAARAAAGLPPMENQNANPSVTMTPPAIAPSRGTPQQRGPSGPPYQQQSQQHGQQYPQQYAHQQQQYQQQQYQPNRPPHHHQSYQPPQQTYQGQQGIQPQPMQFHTQPPQPPYQPQQSQQQRQTQQQQPQPSTPAAAAPGKQTVPGKQPQKQAPPQRRVTRTPSTGSRRNSKTTKSMQQGAVAARGSPTASAVAATGSANSPQPSPSEGHLSLTAATPRGPGPHLAPLVGERIADLVKSIDPNYVIDRDAEEQVLQLADDFLDKVTRQATRLAQHRNSKVVDVQDLQIVLAKNFGIVVPGLGLPNIRPLGVPKTAAVKRKSPTVYSVDGPSRKKSSTAVSAKSSASQGS